MILWLLLGAAAVFALGWLLLSNDGSAAETIIKRRYARGEIDRETFERMLDDVYRSANRLRDHGSETHCSQAPYDTRR